MLEFIPGNKKISQRNHRQRPQLNYQPVQPISIVNNDPKSQIFSLHDRGLYLLLAGRSNMWSQFLTTPCNNDRRGQFQTCRDKNIRILSKPACYSSDSASALSSPVNSNIIHTSSMTCFSVLRILSNLKVFFEVGGMLSCLLDSSLSQVHHSGTSHSPMCMIGSVV